MSRPPRTNQPWRKQPRRPLATLPAVAAKPVLFGPAFAIGGAHELLRHGEAASVVAGATALLAGLATVGLAATYALRPTTQRVE